jgi:hypothetical protein
VSAVHEIEDPVREDKPVLTGPTILADQLLPIQDRGRSREGAGLPVPGFR